MADYHPLIARAVAGLDKNTSEARRSLYERARTALVEQLRGATPALSESDITRERLALEEAIRKIEAEEAKRGRRERPQPASSPPPAQTSPAPPTPAPPEDSPSALAGERAASGESDASTSRRIASPSAWPPMASLAVETTPAVERKAAPAVPPEPRRQVPPDPAQHGPADQLSEADGVPSSSAPAPEPSVEPPPGGVAPDSTESARLETALRKLRGRFTSGRESDLVTPRPPVPPPEHHNEERQGHEPDALAAPAIDRKIVNAGSDIAEPYPDQPLPDQPERRRWRVSGAAVKAMIVIVALAVLAALAAVGYRERGSIVALYHLFNGPAAPVPREEAKTQQPKIEDRVASVQSDRLPGIEQRMTGPAAQPPPAVAQRVVLYEEDPSNPAGKRYVGSAIWRTETVSPGPGLAPELAVKAKIEIPERRMTMTFSMVRNTDPTLPASHTVDIRFSLPPDFPGGGIANVPGILMKQAEQTRGVPLAGIAVKVTNNVFLIGLSSVDSDVQRNTQLLRERSWFDIPIVYSNGSRAILAMEKGTPGERAFSDAFTAWGRSGTASR